MADKAQRLIEARRLPMAEWRQAHVQAWTELELGLPPAMCAAIGNDVKSGKVCFLFNEDVFQKEKSKVLNVFRFRVPHFSGATIINFQCFTGLVGNQR